MGGGRGGRCCRASVWTELLQVSLGLFGKVSLVIASYLPWRLWTLRSRLPLCRLSRVSEVVARCEPLFVCLFVCLFMCGASLAASMCFNGIISFSAHSWLILLGSVVWYAVCLIFISFIRQWVFCLYAVEQRMMIMYTVTRPPTGGDKWVCCPGPRVGRGTRTGPSFNYGIIIQNFWK